MQTELPRRPYVELPPPPDGFATARREASRRRTRRAIAAVTGGISAVVVAVVALVVGGSDGVAVLRPAPVAPATQLPAPGGSTPMAVASGPAAKQAVPGSSAGSKGQGHQPGPSPAASTSSGPSNAHRSAIVVVRTQSRYTGYPRVCRTGDQANNDSVRPGADWCSDAAATPTKAGEQLSLTLCRDSTTGGTLTFANTREVDFAVVEQGTTIWRWSHDTANSPSRHTLSASADGCWVWSLVWPGVTQSGAGVGHGAYTLVATTAADELQGSATTQVPFSY